MLPGILLIEDESTLAKNIRSYLSREGFDVRVAATGEGGLEEFERFKPDIVLLDYNLPDTDGLCLLERLKSVDPSVNVVMITGEGTVDVAVAAMKAGVRDYLAKPLVLGELRILLKRMAGEADRTEGVECDQTHRGVDQIGEDRSEREEPEVHAFISKRIPDERDGAAEMPEKHSVAFSRN